MRILKYIFLLIVLAMVALTVFVATQKGEFDVTKSRVINSPRNVIFNYVNDYRNWENWGSWKAEDPEMKFNYPVVTAGKGASYSWVGSDSEGNMQTIFAKENDSIAQKMIYNGSPSNVSWRFKDTIGGTKVIWHAKGRLDFMSKIYAAAKGGAGTIFSEMFEKSLANLDKTLDYEINTYSITIGGVTEKTGIQFLRHTINSTIANAPKNTQLLLSKMTRFFRKNKIFMNGKPFIIYHKYDAAAGITKFSVCMPIRDEIYTSAGSDIMFDQVKQFRAVKVTLNGDYSHRKEAWDKAAKYISDNKLERSSDFKTLEILTKGIEEIKSPSKWITDIYIPIRSEQAVPPTLPTAVRASRPAPVSKPVAEAPVVVPSENASVPEQ